MTIVDFCGQMLGLQAAAAPPTSINIMKLSPGAVKEFAKQVINEFIDKCEEPGWEHGGEEKAVHIYRKEYPPLKAVKGVGIVKGDIDRMFELTKQVDNIGKWDHLFISGRVVHSFDENIDIITVQYNSGVPFVSSRDFVYIEARTKLPNGTYIIAATSVLHPDIPECQGFVRAEVRESGWMLKPIGEDEVEAVYIAQVDPKGMIPKAIVKAASGTEAMNINNLRLCLADYELRMQQRQLSAKHPQQQPPHHHHHRQNQNQNHNQIQHQRPKKSPFKKEHAAKQQSSDLARRSREEEEGSHAHSAAAAPSKAFAHEQTVQEASQNDEISTVEVVGQEEEEGLHSQSTAAAASKSFEHDDNDEQEEDAAARNLSEEESQKKPGPSAQTPHRTPRRHRKKKR